MNYYNRSIFLKIKLDVRNINYRYSSLDSCVPSQQSEVILVILESKHGIIIIFLTKCSLYRRDANLLDVT